MLRSVELQDAAAIQATFFPQQEAGVFQAQFQSWQAQWQQGRLFYLLAECKGQVVGQGQLHRWPGGRAEIANMQVAAAWQNQGIGTAILDRLIQKARQWNCPVIEIAVANNNPRAQDLYQRLGFQVVHPLLSAHDAPGVIMQREL